VNGNQLVFIWIGSSITSPPRLTFLDASELSSPQPRSREGTDSSNSCKSILPSSEGGGRTILRQIYSSKLLLEVLLSSEDGIISKTDRSLDVEEVVLNDWCHLVVAEDEDGVKPSICGIHRWSSDIVLSMELRYIVRHLIMMNNRIEFHYL